AAGGAAADLREADRGMDARVGVVCEDGGTVRNAARINSHPPRSPFLWKGEEKREASGSDSAARTFTPFLRKGVARSAEGWLHVADQQPSPSRAARAFATLRLPLEGGRRARSVGARRHPSRAGALLRKSRQCGFALGQASVMQTRQNT